MFNLLVSANGTAWETDQLMRMDVARFKEYSGSEARSISLDDPDSLKKLESIPTLLMYELGADGPAAQIVRFGSLRDIALSRDEITFRFVPHGHVARSVIERFGDWLGINRFQHTRKHWAIMDGDIPGEVLDRITPTPYGMQISELTRRAVIDSLLLRPTSFHGSLGLMEFLKRIWNLSSMRSTDPRFDNAEADIWQHTVNNNDWGLDHLLFDYLELRSCTDRQFLRFVETAVHPLVGDDAEIRSRVSTINGILEADGYRLVQTSELSSRAVFSAKKTTELVDLPDHAYEVVLSFAGEDRKYVEEVAELLRQQGVKVFYDRYEEATLWGKDLAEHLDTVYRKDARYCVMFISKHYAEKVWTNHERRAALARAIEERTEYILPARFDGTAIPGVRPTLGYVDLSQRRPDELAALISKKLGRTAR